MQNTNSRHKTTQPGQLFAEFMDHGPPPKYPDHTPYLYEYNVRSYEMNRGLLPGQRSGEPPRDALAEYQARK